MEKEEKIASLAKPVKKGILRLIFSRFFLIVLLLILQVGLAVSAFLWFRKALPAILYIQTAFVFAMVVYLFNCSMDSSAKLTWIFIISIIPLAGAAMLLFTQMNIGHRMETELVKKQINDTLKKLDKDGRVLKAVEHDGSGTDDLCRYLNKTGCFPLYDRTRRCLKSLRKLRSTSSWSTSS